MSPLLLGGLIVILAIDSLGEKHNRNIKVRAQLRILKCIAIVKEASRKVLKLKLNVELTKHS